MAVYKVKTPWWVRDILYRRLQWRLNTGNEPAVYLTFDDGPHPLATEYVLEQLDKYNAKASFFCIGKNVVNHPELYKKILDKGHTTGNHTHNHMNGWFTDTEAYLENIHTAAEHITSNIFRPPYGKIKRSQTSGLLNNGNNWRIYMWDVLSGDFDLNISPQQCLDNVLQNIEPGSIVVFHDSEKAWERMSFALPKVLEHCHQKGWAMKTLPTD